jgi:LuxR family maltose regulon positive regulatory protein
VLWEWNNLAGAREQAQQGIVCARQWGHQEHITDGYLCIANIQWSLGDITGALSTLAEAEPLVLQPTANPEVVARFTSFQASRWILLGRLDEAQHWADSFDAGIEGDARLHKPGILTLARLRLAQGAPDAARILLDQLLVIVDRAGLTEDKIHISILLALVLQAAHSSTKAEQALREALALAETEGYQRTFLDEGSTLASLLEVVASSSGTGARYAQILLADLGQSTRPHHQNQHLSHVASSTLLEPLTRREQEVLGLIAEGASNQQIAEALVIALGTVKKHVTTIFAKLGVNSRTQLLARARELGLIQL